MQSRQALEGGVWACMAKLTRPIPIWPHALMPPYAGKTCHTTLSSSCIQVGFHCPGTLCSFNALIRPVAVTRIHAAPHRLTLYLLVQRVLRYLTRASVWRPHPFG